VYFAEVLQERQVPVLIEQPGFDTRDLCGQPLAVLERNELVLPAVHEQNRNRDIGQLESPRAAQLSAVVIPVSLGGSDPGLPNVPREKPTVLHTCNLNTLTCANDRWNLALGIYRA
jgi:hypothetical protein